MNSIPKRYVQIDIRKHPTHHLTEDEKAHPWHVFAKLFDEVTVTDFREKLWKSFLCTMMGTYPTPELTAREREDIVYVYEWMKKLIDAAHIINEHEKLKSPYNHYHFLMTGESNEWNDGLEKVPRENEEEAEKEEAQPESSARA